MMTIVKVKRPSDFVEEMVPAMGWFAHDRDRTAAMGFPATDALRAAMGKDLVGYFEAEVDETGRIYIGKRVPDEVW